MFHNVNSTKFVRQNLARPIDLNFSTFSLERKLYFTIRTRMTNVIEYYYKLMNNGY
jgi:hypothetical protein